MTAGQRVAATTAGAIVTASAAIRAVVGVIVRAVINRNNLEARFTFPECVCLRFIMHSWFAISKACLRFVPEFEW